MKEATARLALQLLSHVLMGPICTRAQSAQIHKDPGQERHELATTAGPQLCAKE